MTHSIELLPDDSSSARIRAQWAALLDAGLPSRARVTSETNRPHATLLAAPSIGVGALAALGPLAMRLPVACTLGAAVIFPAGAQWTLARLVVPTTELLSIHATAVRLVTPLLTDSAYGHCTPGRWTPHLTLARRLTAAQVTESLSVIDATQAPITFDAVRLWDGDARTEQVLSGRTC